VRSGMGETYRSLARYEEAEGAFRQALRYRPGHAATLAGLGRLCFERAGSREELRRADQLFRQSIAADPRNADTLYYSGFLQRKLGNEREAVRVLERALALSPSHTGAMYQLGQAYVALGRTADANRLLQRFRGMELAQREREMRSKRREAP